jgi:Mn-dependent DtxR family transcriptional regulator
MEKKRKVSEMTRRLRMEQEFLMELEELLGVTNEEVCMEEQSKERLIEELDEFFGFKEEDDEELPF